MALKKGDKIVAHTRLAFEFDGAITMFTPGEIIVAGDLVSLAQAQEWLDRGSAAIATDDDVKAWAPFAAERAAEKAAAAVAAAEAAKPAPAA